MLTLIGRQAIYISAVIGLIVLAAMSKPCSAQSAPPSGASPDLGQAAFERSLQSATRTLDAISQLIDAVHARRAEELRVPDVSRVIFNAVPLTDPAYEQMATLQKHGIAAGYPDGYFLRQRTLKRYDFAVALYRTLQRSGVLTQAASKSQESPSGAISHGDLLLVSRLVQEFVWELRALGMNAREARKRLDARLGHSHNSNN